MRGRARPCTSRRALVHTDGRLRYTRIAGNADTSAGGELLAYGCGPVVIITYPAAACALTALRGHTARVNCVRWVPSGGASGSSAARHDIVSASCDGTLRLWRWRRGEPADGPGDAEWRGGWHEAQVMSGHTGSVMQIALKVDSAAAWCYAASVGADSKLVIWRSRRSGSGEDGPWEECRAITFPPKQQPTCVALANSAASASQQSDAACLSSMIIAAVGHVDSRIRIYAFSSAAPAAAASPDQCTPLCVLHAHSDWVTCLDLCETRAGPWGLFLASASADTNIRIWHIAPEASVAPAPNGTGEDRVAGDCGKGALEGADDAAGRDEGEGEGAQESLVRRPRDSVSETVKRHRFLLGDRAVCLKLEALLVGHEDRVHSVRWRPHAEAEVQVGVGPDSAREARGMCLLSSSMDKTMQLWAPADDDGVWTSQVRVGDIGGQPGQLGYYGALFVALAGGEEEDGATLEEGRVGAAKVQGLLAHGHNGAFFAWRPRLAAGEERDAEAVLSEHERWDSQATGAGHYAAVHDVSWEPLGNYLITVSKDQTARVWARWTEGQEAAARTQRARSCRGAWLGSSPRPPGASSCFGSYAELARPQVHGFDLRCVALVGALSHAYVSGADDEKVLRVFNAPSAFVDTLRLLCGEAAALDPHAASRSDFASLPALGLSNKPMAEVDATPGHAVPPASGRAAGAPAAEADEGRGAGAEEIEALMQGYGDGMVQDDAPVPATARRLLCAPTEEELLQHTLWPEVSKLYGHGNACFCVAGANKGSFVAAACRAAESQQGQVP